MSDAELEKLLQETLWSNEPTIEIETSSQSVLTVQDVKEKIAEIEERINQQDATIRVGEEHLNNQYKDWRVYKDEHGNLVPIERCQSAQTALENAKNERSALEQTLHNYQSLLPPVEMRDKNRYLDLVRQEEQLKIDLRNAEAKSSQKNKSFREARKKKENYKNSDNPFKKVPYEAG